MKKKISLIVFTLCFASQYAFCEDNLLAVDVGSIKGKAAVQEDKTSVKQEDKAKDAAMPVNEPLPKDDSDSDIDFKRIKAYRELIDNKEKDLEIIKLDLEKSGLLLKKKEAEKQIYEIDKALPQGKKEESQENSLLHEVRQAPIDSADIKILLLVISDDLKEGLITLKGVPYSFKEGDCIASRLTVDKIDSSSVTFRQLDGTVSKLNFVN